MGEGRVKRRGSDGMDAVAAARHGKQKAAADGTGIRTGRDATRSGWRRRRDTGIRRSPPMGPGPARSTTRSGREAAVADGGRTRAGRVRLVPGGAPVDSDAAGRAATMAEVMAARGVGSDAGMDVTNEPSESDDDFNVLPITAPTSDVDTSSGSDEDACLSENPFIGEALFECFKQQKIAHLKRKFASTLIHNSVKKSKFNKRASPSPASGFTRFSVKYFSDVLSALSPHQRSVIEHYGFGCLLKFDKCVVPKRFAKWIARQVDVRSRDIVLNNKIISFTKECVHWVLDLPLGGHEIIPDCEAGRKFLLSEFGKSSMPPISFFGSMLKQPDLSDEKTFICFMIVALSSFLCPTSNFHPSSKYFCIFEDLAKVKDLDISKLVLDWLMDMISKFSVGNKCTRRKSKSLGGCIYFLAYICLERRYDSFSELDEISDSVFGKRPLKDFSSTCYSQATSMNVKPCVPSCQDSKVSSFDFKNVLDDRFGDILPLEMQVGLWDIVQKSHTVDFIDADIKSEVLVVDVLQYLHDHYYAKFYMYKPKVDGSFDASGIDKVPGESNNDLFESVVDEQLKVVEDSLMMKAAVEPKCDDDDDEGNIHFDAIKSPEVQITFEQKFSEKCATLSSKADAIYNELNVLNPELSKLKGESGSSAVASASTSGGKLPAYGLRRVIRPNKDLCGPFLSTVRDYPVSVAQRRFYFVICKLGRSKCSNLPAFQLNKVHITYKSMSESMELNGNVDNFFIAACCRKFFDEVHPSKSKKHYFFSYIDETILILDPNSEMPMIRKAFEGASLARKMHLSNMHWFLFVVDIKDRLFVFLDSLFSEDDEYQVYVRGVLVESFKILWSRFNSLNHLPFEEYRVVYPTTPKQENKDDYDVFLIKFLGLWNSPRVCLPTLLSSQHIPNIRIQLVNEFFFSPLNQADKSVVLKIYDEQIFLWDPVNV
ncbi:hypothetical protein ACP4OV_015676 [Aristida adscensionis]